MANTKHSAAREIIIDRLLRERRGYSLQEMNHSNGKAFPQFLRVVFVKT